MARKGLFAKLIGYDERETYDDLAAKHGCVFDSMKWTGLFEPHIRRVGIYDAGENLRGGFCFFEQRKFGLRILRNPPFTPYIGPFFDYKASNASAINKEKREVIEATLEYVNKYHAAMINLNLARDIEDCIPFYWSGYKVIPHWVYCLDLRPSSDKLLEGMSTSHRKSLKKAVKDGIIVSEEYGSPDIRAMARHTFSRQNEFMPLRYIDGILNSYTNADDSISVIAKSGDHAMASVFFIFDSHAAYGIMSGFDDENRHHGAGVLAMWHVIQKAKEKGLEIFDFAGSVIPPIERYLSAFGGHLNSYLSIHKAWLPLEMLLKIHPQYRNRF